MTLVKFCIEEDFVGQVTGSFSVNVKAGAAPVSIVPSTGALPDETEGVAISDKVAIVSGGVPPYNYVFAGQPDGIGFVEKDNFDGTFTILAQGTPSVGDAAGSPYTVTVTVTDSSPATQSAVRSLNVKPAA